MSEVNKLIARERNLKFIIVRKYLQEHFPITKKFSREDISKLFYFRQADFADSLTTFFQEKNNSFIMKKKIFEEIKEIIEKHNKSKQNEEQFRTNYIKIFKDFKTKSNLNPYSFNFEEYQKLYVAVKPYIESLHWSQLPEISEQMMINSEMIPEDNLTEYYNHYHTLEDMYEVLIGNLVPSNSYKGDLNLNKKLSFEVYTRRWGHTDTYRIERRIKGWFISHISINGLSNKQGEPTLSANLKHDSIQYPEEGIKYAFETLWELADETEMSVDELQTKLQEIADWISEIEKTVGRYQPDWCNYY